jgi:hypothetical protein
MGMALAMIKLSILSPGDLLLLTVFVTIINGFSFLNIANRQQLSDRINRLEKEMNIRKYPD